MNGVAGIAPMTSGRWMRGAAGGGVIEIVIAVCAACAGAENASAQARDAGSASAGSRDTRRIFDMGRLLVSSHDLANPGEMTLAIAGMFELWSICDDAPGEGLSLGRDAVAAAVVRGPEVQRGRRPGARPRAAGDLGAAPAPARERVAHAGRGAALVDVRQRLLRKRGDAH